MLSILPRFLVVLSLLWTVVPLDAVAQVLLPSVSIRTSVNTWYDDTPADFNGDGIVDLAGASPSGATHGAIQVRLGNGDGSFRSPIVSSTRGYPLAAGDINRDGRPDVVALVWTTPARLAVLGGLGDGRLGPARPVDDIIHPSFAALGDLDGNGTVDLVSGSYGEVFEIDVSPGNGDLTFGAPVHVYAGGAEWPLGGAIADVNADGRLDVAVAHKRNGVRLLINRGNFSFDVSAVPGGSGHSTTDVAARDVSGDGKIDLLVTGRSSPSFEHPWQTGYVFVALGNGDGTFTNGGEYPTAPGANSVVVGDFSRDGILDIATSNHSYWSAPNGSICGVSYQGANSVSILPGRGNGTFGAATSFALSPQGLDEIRGGGAAMGQLHVADINRDGFLDLLPGWGIALVNSAPRENRPPTVSAGADYFSTWGPEMILNGTVSDPDGHFLTARWGGGNGGTFHSDDAPVGCYEAATPTGTQLYGEHTFEITVSDGHGGTASDRVTVTYLEQAPPNVLSITTPAESETLIQGVPYTIRWTAGTAFQRFHVWAAQGFTQHRIAECENLPGTARQCTWNSPGPLGSVIVISVRGVDSTGATRATWTHVRIAPAAPLPSGWSNRDIGGVAAAGSARMSSDGTMVVSGSGADIWGTSDEFHYAYTTVTGDFEVAAQVRTVQNVDRWTKAGLMVRDGTAANARHASLFVTPTTEKGIAFQRRTTTGGASTHTAGPAMTAPVWVRLVRTGNTLRAYWRLSSEAWMLVGTQTFTALPASLLVGFAVTSHADGRLATATFSGFSLGSGAFQSTDIGAVGVAGTTTATSTGLRIEGSGADIWGTADAFRYHSRPWTGDATITVRVSSIERTHDWAKAGVMFRESLAPNARHIMLIVSPRKGIAVQYRGSTGGASAQVASRPGTAPEWLRLTRTGNAFTAEVSEDGIYWDRLGYLPLSMNPSLHVGVAVTSHNNSTLATAVFEQLSVAP